MHSTVHYLAAAVAGALLFGCAGVGQPPSPPADAALAVHPGAAADGYYALGRRQHAAGRDADALRAYRQALQIDPAHMDARNGLAVLSAGQGDYARAIALWQGLTAGTAPAPHSAYLFSNLGYAYFLNGEQERALAALEQACLLDPLNALSWEHLGSVLERMGQGERAALMYKQARSLQAHDARNDYALAGRDAAPVPAPASASALTTQRAEAWPDTMARMELVAGAGILQLRRVPARAPVVPAPAPAFATPAAVPPAGPPPAAPAPSAPLRVEIRNGNGVPGMAEALARTLNGGQLRVVRLGNERSFRVERSRVEYGPDQRQAAHALATGLGPLVILEQAACRAADLRVVLGRDLLDPVALHRYYLKRLKLARLELERLG